MAYRKRRVRKYLKSRYGRVGYKRRRYGGARVSRKSGYRMHRRNRRNISQKHKLGSLFCPKIGGLGNFKTTILRGCEIGEYILSDVNKWQSATTDYEGKGAYHPLWFWDPFNNWKTDTPIDKSTLTLPLDGIGYYKNNYNCAQTQNVYWKMKLTNTRDIGVIKVFAIVTDTYTYINQVVSAEQLIGGAANGKVYNIAPGKSITIKVKLSPIMWAKMRRENTTNTTVKMGPNSIVTRQDYSKPIYEPWIQIWIANASAATGSAAGLAYEIWQWSKIRFYNRRSNFVIESAEADGPQGYPYQEDFTSVVPAEQAPEIGPSDVDLNT